MIRKVFYGILNSQSAPALIDALVYKNEISLFHRFSKAVMP